MADIISQAMQDGDISSIELHKVLQEGEKYRKLKTEKNCLNREEKKAKKIFYEKSQILQVSRV